MSCSIRTRVARAVIGVVGAAILLASCKGDPAAKSGHYYVSVGDSYATGVQPTPKSFVQSTRNGFAYQVVSLARQKGRRLTLANFGCGGATTRSILLTPGCKNPATSGPPYTESQADAAAAFVREHKGSIDVVTISIGGNELVTCARQPSFADCLTRAMPDVEANIGTLVRQLVRAGVAPDRILGLTYPEILLGAWTWQNPDRDRVRTSQELFKTVFNPALKRAYEQAGATFLDITAASGGYDSLETTTSLAPYGTVPVAVARVCQLTFYCQFRDVHARTAGYRLIAEQIVGALPQTSSG